MAQNTIAEQHELDAPGFESPEERRRRDRAELLRRAGVRPASGSMLRDDRVTVRPYPLWLHRLAKLFS